MHALTTAPPSSPQVRWAEFVPEAELASWAVGKLEKGSVEGRATTATAATATAATATAATATAASAAAAPPPLLLSPTAAALLSERAAAVESLLQDQEKMSAVLSAEATACLTPPIDATRSGRRAQDGAWVTPTDAERSASSRFTSPLRARASSLPPPPPPALAVPTTALPSAPTIAASPPSQPLATPERWGGDGDVATASGVNVNVKGGDGDVATASGMAGAAAAVGTPWLGSGGAALLRLAVADGACVRLQAQHVELRARASLLFDHMNALLQEQLEAHPWYAEPLRVAAERARKHLGSERLRVHGALKIELSVDNAQDGARESHLVVEGMPCAIEADEREDDGPSSPSRATSSGVCATFEIDINLLDLVTDVQDIYRSFLANNHTLLDKMAKGGGVTAAK